MSEEIDKPHTGLPEEVQEALDRIAKDDPDGLIQPEAVVEAAQDPKSPLHRYFDWDEETAAQKYRLAQARALIVRCGITRVDDGPRQVNVVIRRGTPNERRGYIPVARAVHDPDLYEQIVYDARRAIVSWRNRLSAFEAAHGIVADLDQALGQMSTPSIGREEEEDA